MNSDQFVEAINAAVCHPAINGVLATIASPPGRKPQRDLAELSSWYNGLADDGKNQVRVLVRRAVHQAIFDIMAVLDGAKVIDDEHTDLYLRTGDGTLINDPAANELHALFQITVDHELGYVDESGNPIDNS
jgi:hypothetical protein